MAIRNFVSYIWKSQTPDEVSARLAEALASTKSKKEHCRDMAAARTTVLTGTPMDLDRKTVLWLAKAAHRLPNMEGRRIILACVHVGDYFGTRYAIATDGYRAHVVETDLPLGLYLPHNGKLYPFKTTTRYPDMGPFLSAKYDRKENNPTRTIVVGGKNRDVRGIQIMGRHFDPDLIKDASGFQECWTWKINTDKDRSPILLEGDNCLAIVMPMHFPNPVPVEEGAAA